MCKMYLQIVHTVVSCQQRSGSLTFCYGSGSADPCLWPTIRIQVLLFSSETFKTQKNYFFAYYLLKVHLHHFLQIKIHKEVTKHQGFSYYWCLMIEGSGSSDPEHCMRVSFWSVVFSVCAAWTGLELWRRGLSIVPPESVLTVPVVPR
jgi:hypothetical protein